MLIKVDAQALEWRGAVWLSNDPVGIEELNNGYDVHSNNQGLFALPSRLIAKKYLFRTIYRGSGWAFANDNEFSPVSNNADFWDDINEKFYKKYKGLDAWHKTLARTVAARKPIVSPFGREWLILPTHDGKLPWTVFTNHPVQGTCADLMTVARVSLWRRMKKLGLRSRLVSTVHDDIKADAPDEEVETVVNLAYEVFADIPLNVKKLFNVDLPVKFPGEVKVGKNLKEMTESAYSGYRSSL
jgi:DNA polymerase I-like protein with 3'-5' exonuclease and polymerase domains